MNQTDPHADTGSPQLKKALGPITLWGLGVGYVISGEYFGWNIGLIEGGTYGMLLAFVLVTTMYITFVFSYTEMACAIPRAGGVFVYAGRGIGPVAAYLGGVAQAVEFVFAPPAIAEAIGGYLQTWIKVDTVRLTAGGVEIDARIVIAITAYVIFTLLNIWGVRQAAMFELIVTIWAVAGLLLFAGVTIPHIRWEYIAANAWPNGWPGAIAAIPFAIWFYLAIEGVANAAEEAVHPQRDVSRGFGGAMITLVLLASLALVCSVGVGGWERVVYPPETLSIVDGTLLVAQDAEPLDTPIPLAVGHAVGESSWVHPMLIGIGLLGLVASFNGIILASGRALFETGRVGFFFRYLGHTHPKTQTPVMALLTNMAIGIVAILFWDTGGLITMAAFGAVTLYIVSMVALFALRRNEPDLERPYKTPCYPWFPLTALVTASFCLVTMSWFNLSWNIQESYTVWYFGFLALAFLYYILLLRGRPVTHDTSHFT